MYIRYIENISTSTDNVVTYIAVQRKKIELLNKKNTYQIVRKKFSGEEKEKRFSDQLFIIQRAFRVLILTSVCDAAVFVASGVLCS